MDSNELKKYAACCIQGSGIEIGALHNPMPLNSDVIVKYVDRLPKETLMKHYPEVITPLVDIDIIDDGEKLTTFNDNSLDFIIANNFIEHCKNPILAIKSHLSKLKNNGTLFYIVPDKRFTFDKERELTTIEHLMDDYFNDDIVTDIDRHYNHYIEWALTCNNLKGEEAQKQAKYLHDIDYSIHFHTFTNQSLLNFINYCKKMFTNFEIQLFAQCGIENIIIVKKMIL